LSEITKALSVRAPWWWFILHGGKDIENRNWPTKFRGTVYLHASTWWSLATVAQDCAVAVIIAEAQRVGRGLPEAETTYRQMRDVGGCIVGQVDIVDCIDSKGMADRSKLPPWFFGEYGFKLANPVAYATPVPCRGMLGLFSVPADVRVRIEKGRA